MNGFPRKIDTFLEVLLLGMALVGLGCGNQPQAPAEETGTKTSRHEHEPHKEIAGNDGHEHHHTAPHGGTLVAIGDHFAHLEVVLDSETGNLTVYVLDGEAENPIRLKQETLKFSVALKKEGKNPIVTTMELAAVESPLTGETVGDTSEFFARNEKLRGVRELSAVISNLEIKGKRIDDLEFGFPQGNEH